MGLGGDDSWSPSVSPEFILSDDVVRYTFSGLRAKLNEPDAAGIVPLRGSLRRLTHEVCRWVRGGGSGR
jgi:hypothetical protein